MADKYTPDEQDRDEQAGQSIFDLFEPPPEPHPNQFGKIPVVRNEDGEEVVVAPLATEAERQAAAEAEAAGLQHWTAPATGQIPAVLGPEGDGEEQRVRGPSWHGDDPSWSGPDLSDVFADEEGVSSHNSPDSARRAARITRVPRETEALQAQTTVHTTPPEAPRPLQTPAPVSAGRSAVQQAPVSAPVLGGGVFAESQPAYEAPPLVDERGPEIDPGDEEYYDYYEEEDDYGMGGLGPVGGRDLPKAILAGVGLVALLGLAVLGGPTPMLVLIVLMALLAVVELYNAMRIAGLRPATLLGIVATIALPAAAFYRGDAGFPLVIALTVIFGFLWYLVGADNERPVLNLSLTVFAVLWVGGLASFAALMLRQEFGIEILVATIVITVASDTMAYIGGRALGSRQFHAASPNKTWEGTMIGFCAALFTGFALGVLPIGDVFQENFLGAILLGAVVGLLAPMGDLAESLVKRDLGIKDMGTIIPGHGGVLDRLDGLLFALPAAYYLSLVYGLFPT